MLKKILLSTALSASVLVAHAVEISPYLSFEGGQAYLNDINDLNSTDTYSFEEGIVYGGAFGIRFDPENDYSNLRIEAALNLQENDVAETSLPTTFTAHTLFVNGYVDFWTGTRLKPYFTAGAGVARIQWETMGVTDFESNGAGQVGGGLSIEAVKKILFFDLKYNYVILGDYKNAENDTHLEFDGAHQAKLGMRIDF